MVPPSVTRGRLRAGLRRRLAHSVADRGEPAVNARRSSSIHPSAGKRKCGEEEFCELRHTEALMWRAPTLFLACHKPLAPSATYKHVRIREKGGEVSHEEEDS